MTTTTQAMRKLSLIVLMIWVIETTSLKTWAKETKTPSIYEALKAEGLPMGLFPKGVKNYTIGTDGEFEVHLDQACNAKFESELHYDLNVSGRLSYGQIRNLSGISAQELFLWFPVKEIRVDVPDSGIIYFDVGVVHKQFSLSMFETPPDCVAASHPPDLHRPQIRARRFYPGGLAKKLNGILRYAFDQGKDAREVM